jgi:hypothetical protein
VISQHSVDSKWVKKELELALHRELQEDRVVVLPIVLDKAELPTFLRGKLYADFSAPEKYYTELGKLLATLGAHQRPGQRVYISYTHDSPEHKAWVEELCRKLVLDGKNAIYDYSFMQPGRDFWEAIFLELSRTNCVLLIVTPTYKMSALGIGRVGLQREYDEILRLAASRSDMRVVPVLREGNLPGTIPDEFSTRFAIDMRGYPPNENAYQQLLKVLA